MSRDLQAHSSSRGSRQKEQVQRGGGGVGPPSQYRTTGLVETGSHHPRGSRDPANSRPRVLPGQWAAGEVGGLTFSTRSSGAGSSKSWILSSRLFLRRSTLLLLLARGLLALDCCWGGREDTTVTPVRARGPASQASDAAAAHRSHHRLRGEGQRDAFRDRLSSRASSSRVCGAPPAKARTDLCGQTDRRPSPGPAPPQWGLTPSASPSGRGRNGPVDMTLTEHGEPGTGGPPGAVRGGTRRQ